MNGSSNERLPSVTRTLVADEVLLESASAVCSCPACGAKLSKRIFADGDSESCPACNEALWFELREQEVRAHRVNQKPQGLSLSELMRARQLK